LEGLPGGLRVSETGKMSKGHIDEQTDNRPDGNDQPNDELSQLNPSVIDQIVVRGKAALEIVKAEVVSETSLNELERRIRAAHAGVASAFSTAVERAIEAGTAGLLAQAVTTFDRLLTAILANNNLG
jgi:hypothetical protein